MNSPIPYLNFAGNCEEAFRFYCGVFGGTAEMHRFKEMPPDVPVPPGYGDKLMHVTLLQDGRPMLMDRHAPEGYGPPFNPGNNVHLSLQPADEAQAKTWYEALREGGRTSMELQPTFWAKLFAMVQDRFGVYWMISFGDPGAK